MAIRLDRIVDFPARPDVGVISASIDGPVGATAGTHTIYGSRNGPRTQVVLLVDGVDAGTVAYDTAWTWRVSGVALEAPSTSLVALAYQDNDKDTIMRRYGLGLVPPAVFPLSLAVAAAIAIGAPSAETELVTGFETAFSGTVSPSDDGVALYRDAECTDKIGDATVPGDGTWTYDWTPEVTDTSVTAVYAKNDSGQSTSVALTVRVSTPNDLVNGSEEKYARGWWSAHPSVGAWTPDNASVPADQSTWDSNLEVTVGGSNAVKATTNSSRHYCYESAPTATIASYCDIDVSDCVPQGSQVWVRVWAGADYCNVNLSTGAEGNKSGADVSCTSGVVAFRSVAARDCRVELLEPALGDDATATPSAYVGSTSDGYTGDVTFAQPRASAWADLSKLPTSETLRGADAGQGTDVNQPLKEFLSVNGQAPLFSEDGRASSLVVTHADVLALGSGDDTQCGLIAVAACESGGRLFRFGGAGGEYQYLERNVNELRLVRRDGSSSGTRTFGSGLGSLLDSANSIALFGIGSRQWALYIGGTYRATVTMADLASATMISFAPIFTTGTGDVVLAEFAAFVDLGSLGTHATIYDALKNQGGLAAMAARSGVTA